MHQRIGAGGVPITLGDAVDVVAGNAVDTSLWARGEDMSVNLGHDRVGIVLTGTVANFVVGALCLRLKARYKQATLLTT
ncbi:unnamed protein product [marine sediment metagenome]|uniref:Uncharacterized protein n=1 Tax=marine sediment metagenome TaxID=412755 RepID=X1H6B6_9ZZZZ